MNNLEQKLETLKEEVEKIKLRNQRVEADKAWELSKTRTAFIAVSTYLLILTFMLLIKDDHPFLNAFVASAGYLISSASYGILKQYWLEKRNSK